LTRRKGAFDVEHEYADRCLSHACREEKADADGLKQPIMWIGSVRDNQVPRAFRLHDERFQTCDDRHYGKRAARR
jgi:hypothetical protein